MNTYLFVWNPELWKWVDLDTKIEELAVTGKTTERWSCRSHKSIKQGDRAFLLKLGTYPKGIIGSGTVVSQPFLSKHWSGEDKMIHRVIIEFDELINPNNKLPLPLDALPQGQIIKQNWTPQSSGISIDNNIADKLERLWLNYTNSKEFTHEKLEYAASFAEGSSYQIIATKYERNQAARASCLIHYGYTCHVCDFNFEKKYGEIGKEYIHVHHLNQISSIGEEYIINPIEDLRPVCPNCHAMLHKRKIPYSIEELKQYISNNL
jgi:5-methylcytosine-specific restriction protein A